MQFKDYLKSLDKMCNEGTSSHRTSRSNRYAKGGSVKKELKAVAAKGRYGDTRLAQIGPRTAHALDMLIHGGRKQINPRTGLREYPFVRDPITGEEVWQDPSSSSPPLFGSERERQMESEHHRLREEADKQSADQRRAAGKSPIGPVSSYDQELSLSSGIPVGDDRSSRLLKRKRNKENIPQSSSRHYPTTIVRLSKKEYDKNMPPVGDPTLAKWKEIYRPDPELLPEQFGIGDKRKKKEIIRVEDRSLSPFSGGAKNWMGKSRDTHLFTKVDDKASRAAFRSNSIEAGQKRFRSSTKAIPINSTVSFSPRARNDFADFMTNISKKKPISSSRRSMYRYYYPEGTSSEAYDYSPQGKMRKYDAQNLKGFDFGIEGEDNPKITHVQRIIGTPTDDNSTSESGAKRVKIDD
jgi:hypothetical protein